MTGFDRRSLRDRCIAHLRDEIVTGRLQPGEHIKEVQLSDTMGISRATLREALRSIEHEGLLVNDGKGHMHVRTLTADEIADVFDVRTALEILAACKLAQDPRREQFAHSLQGLLDPLRRTDLGFGERIEFDLGFHAALCELTGNGTLIAAWRNLIGQIRMMIIAAGPQTAEDRMSYDTHLPIVEAIGSGDVAAVRDTISEHMGDFARRYVADAVARAGSPRTP